MSGSLWQPGDLTPRSAGKFKNSDSYLQRQIAYLEEQTRQGVARGVISEDEGNAIVESSDQNWVERTLGFEESGSHFWQPMVDILSLGNYATASLAKARTNAIMNVKDDDTWWEKLTAYTVGISPLEFKENFQKRTTFGEIVQEEPGLDVTKPSTWGGLAADIFLDPVTYLTFGTGAGAKIVLKEAAKTGGKATLTRWGAKVYKEAAAELVPELAEEVTKKGYSTFGSQRQLMEMHERIGRHMVDNYGVLAKKAIQRESFLSAAGLMRKGGAAGRQLAKEAGLEKGLPFGLGEALPSYKTMFKELTPKVTRMELGIPKLSAGLAKVSKTVPYMDQSIRLVNKTWNMNENTKIAWKTAHDTSNYLKRKYEKLYLETLGKFSPDERVALTNYLETGFDSARNATSSLPVKLSDEMLDAANFIKKETDDILEAEQVLRITGDGINDYMTHIIKNKSARDAYTSLLEGTKRTGANPYAKHRVVATTVNASDKLIDDAGEILFLRRTASLDMLAKASFFEHVKITEGFPAALIDGAKTAIPKKIRDALVASRDERVISNIDQLWDDAEINPTLYGFKEGNIRRTKEVVKYLTSSKRVEKDFVTEKLRAASTISPKFTIAKKQYDINDVLSYIFDKDPLGKTGYKEASEVIRRFDKKLRGANIGPILSVLPDLKNNLKQAFPGHKVGALVTALNKPFTKKLAGQFPDEIIIMAQQARNKLGIFTDTTKPAAQVLNTINDRFNKLGVLHEEQAELLKTFTGETSLDKLSARAAELVEDYLGAYLGKGLGGYHLGEDMERVAFAAGKEVTDFSNVKEVIAGIKEEGVTGLQLKFNKARIELAKNKAKILAEGGKVSVKLTNRVKKYAKELGVEVPVDEVVRKKEAIFNSLPLEYDELIRRVGPDAQPGAAPHFFHEFSEWYLPKSTASLIKDIDQRLYGHELAYLMRGYDLVQNFFKAPLMAPFVGFYKRNAVTNIGLSLVKCGVSLLHPGNFRDYMKATAYLIGKESFDLKSAPTGFAAAGVLPGGVLGGIAGFGTAEDDASYAEKVARGLGGSIGGSVGGMTLGATTGKVAKESFQYGPKAFEKVYVKGAQVLHEAFPEHVTKYNKLADAPIKVGDKTFTTAEFVDEMAKHGALNTHVSSEIFDTMQRSASTKNNILGMRDMFRAGELATEIPPRVMLFTTVAKQTGSLHEAGQAVKEYMFDFANLSMFERRFMRRAIPFYTWTKHALNVSWDSIVDNPGNFAAQLKFVRNQNQYEDVDPSDLPDWLSDRLANIDVNKETGEIEVKRGLLGGAPALAIEDAVDIWKTAFGGRKEVGRIFSRGPFLFTSLAEAMLNKDFFRQNAIWNTDTQDSAFQSGKRYENAPDWFKKIMKYDDKTGTVDPTWNWLLHEIPYSRFINVLEDIEKIDGEVNYEQQAYRVFAEKVYKYGPDGKYYRDRAKLERMAIALKRAGLIRGLPVYTSRLEKAKKRQATRVEQLIL